MDSLFFADCLRADFDLFRDVKKMAGAAATRGFWRSRVNHHST
jgi:hypothetical protein